ncbi:probable U3 small nucleolar RNA-associated protein 11 isoform X2 [Littorina saxatilis]|uniref:probable U3 small nucleolar RNA-associated protein 11 isoform X2 n=1 Tax=Littorina saxatilis TaxID=31220 RepID=UPI0038B4D00B
MPTCKEFGLLVALGLIVTVVVFPLGFFASRALWPTSSQSGEADPPAHRAHLGQLEKHKDYVERARDYNKKKEKIKALRVKAANRNPDEFYFNMVSTEKVDGVHQTKEEKLEKLTEEQELLMQRNDLRYVTMKRNVELKKIEKLKADLQLLDPQFRQNKHIVFVDSKKDVPRARTRLEEGKRQQEAILAVTPEQQQDMDKKYGMLAKRYGRLKELTTIIDKLEVSTHLTKDKTSKKKLVKEETKECAAVYRWCYQRKR